MASSQVEFAASSSPFGCIMRDCHHRDRCSRENNARATQAAFHKTFNHFVRDHLNACTNDNQINNNSDSWVPNNAKNNLRKLHFTTKREQDESSLVSPRHWQNLYQDESSSPLLRPSSSTSKRENSKSNSTPHSPISSDGSAKVSNLGASSLVQIWEKRLNKSNITKSTGRSSPSATCSPQGSEGGEHVNEGSFQEWEYEHKTGSSENQTCSPQGQINSDVAESERVRVADIIKRLTATCDDVIDQDQSSPRTPEQPENKAFAQLINSPRIRGRQAFNDLLMQMERDRHGELKNLAERGAVSKFSQRGRIQSLLRLRLLQRGVAANDQCRSQSTTSEAIRQPQGSVIMRLRERFSKGVENGTAAQAEVFDPRSPGREIVNNVTQLDNPPNPFKPTQSAGSHCTTSTQSPVSHSTGSDHNKEEAHPSSDVTITSHEAQNVDLQDTNNVETSLSSMADLKAIEIGDKVEGSDHEKHVVAETSYDEIVEEEVASEQEFGESNFEEIEEVETNEQHYDEASFDWISQISRPRSYWESRRQEWYRKMLDTESKNEDICHLLQRRPVSTFLSSDFRKRMDRLMESHMGTQTNLFSSNHEDEELDNRGRMDQLIALLQEHMRSTKREEKKEIKGEEEEEQHEEEILISGSYNEESDYINQYSSPARTLSSSLSTTWRYRDNEAGDDFDRSASTSILQPSQSQSLYQDSQQYSPSTNHHSIEMELIYDLRGHMKQLYQEMSELRKSIKSCMDMQMILQKSMNRENHTAKGGRKSHDKASKKGNCCICCEKKADSLLYRCGHMCTCLKCANELQWNNGICPICQAPVVDVVRVYVDA